MDHSFLVHPLAQHRKNEAMTIPTMFPKTHLILGNDFLAWVMSLSFSFRYFWGSLW